MNHKTTTLYFILKQDPGYIIQLKALVNKMDVNQPALLAKRTVMYWTGMIYHSFMAAGYMLDFVESCVAFTYQT